MHRRVACSFNNNGPFPPLNKHTFRAIRRYETRRRNGNSGKGKPRSKADQKKAEELAAARAAAIAAGLATEADFAPPPRRVPRRLIPTVKRRPGRPRKLRTEEELAAAALREANGPRPRGRPRNLRPKKSPPSSGRAAAAEEEEEGGEKKAEGPAASRCHVTASLTNVVRAWMANAAGQAAEAAASSGLRSVAPADLESHAKALAVSKTKEVTGAGMGGGGGGGGRGGGPRREGSVWTPRMTSIALAGIEAWEERWKEAFPAAAAAAAATAGEDWGLATDGLERQKGGGGGGGGGGGSVSSSSSREAPEGGQSVFAGGSDGAGKGGASAEAAPADTAARKLATQRVV